MRQTHVYCAIKECHAEYGYPIEVACEILHVARSAYHKWAAGKLSHRAVENEDLANIIEQIHTENPDKGYRRINDDLRHDHGLHINDKRVLRICRVRNIKSTIKYNNHGCSRQAKNPQYLAENLLDRQFYASNPNEKWLTDVTEFKWYEGIEVHKLYLSAILDLCDRRIVSYVLSGRNDTPFVYKSFDKAVKANPDAHPLFHSDRGFQYTSRVFHHKLEKAGMTQSMSRGAHCIDNGPMEGFWGILKREILRQAVHQQAVLHPDEMLYPLLQHPACTAQSRCLDSHGEAQPLAGCIKNGQQPALLSRITLYFFSVFLAGRSSIDPCGRLSALLP